MCVGWENSILYRYVGREKKILLTSEKNAFMELWTRILGKFGRLVMVWRCVTVITHGVSKCHGYDPQCHGGYSVTLWTRILGKI